MKIIYILITIIIYCFFCTKLISGTSIGKLGKVYPIIEVDIIELMKKKAEDFQTSEKYKYQQKKYQQSFINYIKRPNGTTLPKATSYSVRSYVPSITIAEDITDSDGRVLYKRGTIINALKFKSLTKALCFFDGDDDDQVRWVVKTCGNNPLNKLILVQGEYLKISKKYKKRFYFDQKSYLVTKLQIKALPSVVRQKGMSLYVEEYAL